MTSRTGFLISVFGTRMCGQTLLFIVIANCAIVAKHCPAECWRYIAVYPVEIWDRQRSRSGAVVHWDYAMMTMNQMDQRRTCLTNTSTIRKKPCSCENGAEEVDLRPGWGLTGVGQEAQRRCRWRPDRNEFCTNAINYTVITFLLPIPPPPPPPQLKRNSFRSMSTARGHT